MIQLTLDLHYANRGWHNGKVQDHDHVVLLGTGANREAMLAAIEETGGKTIRASA